MKRTVGVGLLVLAAAIGAGCTIDQTGIPPLAGPSTSATSLRVTATPDLLVLNGQQSAVMVEAFDATGSPLPNLRLILDMGGCGHLSSTDVTTGRDGRVGVVFTAPSLPLPMPECADGADEVTISATSVGTNAQVSNGSSAAIRFLTPAAGPSSSVFAVNFSISPNPAAVGTLVSFSDSGSVSPGHDIVGYQWTFSDGHVENGRSISHDFGSSGTHTVTLSITDDIGQSGSKTALVNIN